MNIIDKLVKRFDNENIIKFADKDAFADMQSWAFTGSPTLDYNLGTFGLPQGITEISGVSRGGKTTVALEAMHYFQKENPDTAVCIILSSENRDNKDYARRLGVDVNNVMIVKITFVEEMFLFVKQIIDGTNELFKESKRKDKPRFFFIWDSLGATLSLSEKSTLEENNANLTKALSKGNTLDALKNEKIGSFAKEAKKFAKYIIGEMYSNIIHFVILNHVYDTITGMGISTKKSTGGSWIEYMPTLRLMMSPRGMEKLDDEEVAQLSTVKVVKNDFGFRRKTTVRILLGEGIILSDDDIQYAVEKGIIKKEGARKLSFLNGKISWQSPRDFYNLYHNRNKFLPILTQKIRKAMEQDLLKEKAKYVGDDEVDDEEED